MLPLQCPVAQGLVHTSDRDQVSCVVSRFGRDGKQKREEQLEIMLFTYIETSFSEESRNGIGENDTP